MRAARLEYRVRCSRRCVDACGGSAFEHLHTRVRRQCPGVCLIFVSFLFQGVRSHTHQASTMRECSQLRQTSGAMRRVSWPARRQPRERASRQSVIGRAQRCQNIRCRGVHAHASRGNNRDRAGRVHSTPETKTQHPGKGVVGFTSKIK